MAKYISLKSAVAAVIKTNGVQAITGAVLQNQLLGIIDALGKDFQFGGVVVPTDTFTDTDYNVAFLATTAGTYTNFGGVVLDGTKLCVLSYDGSWTKTELPVPTSAALTAALANYTTTADLEANFAQKDGY